MSKTPTRSLQPIRVFSLTGAVEIRMSSDGSSWLPDVAVAFQLANVPWTLISGLIHPRADHHAFCSPIKYFAECLSEELEVNIFATSRCGFLELRVGEDPVYEWCNDRWELFAHRNLRPRSVPSGEYYGVDHYYSIIDGALPAWWNPEWQERLGLEVLGVLENMPGCSGEALVLRREDISVVQADGSLSTIRYLDIADFGRLSKDPISEQLDLVMRSGTTFSLPVLGQSGAIFDIMRFIMAAAHETKKSHGE